MTENVLLNIISKKLNLIRRKYGFLNLYWSISSIPVWIKNLLSLSFSLTVGNPFELSCSVLN